MGALFEQNLIRTKYGSLKRWLNRHQCSVIGVSPDSQANFHHYDFPNKTLLFLGEEKKGLTLEQRELCQDFVSIPMTGKADSLNLAIAGSLLLYEIHRQTYS